MVGSVNRWLGFSNQHCTEQSTTLHINMASCFCPSCDFRGESANTEYWTSHKRGRAYHHFRGTCPQCNKKVSGFGKKQAPQELEQEPEPQVVVDAVVNAEAEQRPVVAEDAPAALAPTPEATLAVADATEAVAPCEQQPAAVDELSN